MPNDLKRADSALYRAKPTGNRHGKCDVGFCGTRRRASAFWLCHPRPALSRLRRTLMSQVPTARNVALELIGAVLRRKRPLDDAIDDNPAMQLLSGRDRAFARLLVATALRRLGQIDALIASCLSTPLAPRAAAVHDILRLGVAQLLFLRTPPHAAVATSVDLAHGRGFLSHKGLVNAVLRRLSVEGAELVRGQDAGAPQYAGLAVAVVELRLWRRDRPSDRQRASEGGAARPDPARGARGLVRKAAGNAVADRHVAATGRRGGHGTARLCRRRLVGPGCRRGAAGPAVRRCRRTQRRRFVRRTRRQKRSARERRRASRRHRPIDPPSRSPRRQFSPARACRSRRSPPTR